VRLPCGAPLLGRDQAVDGQALAAKALVGLAVVACSRQHLVKAHERCRVTCERHKVREAPAGRGRTRWSKSICGSTYAACTNVWPAPLSKNSQWLTSRRKWRQTIPIGFSPQAVGW
jgi:hypothetical protein